MKFRRARIYHYRLPLVTPVRWGDKEHTEREGALLYLEDAERKLGWGEAAPLPGFSHETLEEAIDDLKQICSDSTNPERFEGIKPAAHFAYASAKLQSTLSYSDTKLVPQNALLSGDGDALCQRAEQATEQGFTAFKMKVGRRPMEEECELVSAVRRIIGPEAALRLDANRGWTLEEAVARCEALQEYNITYIEEPLQNPLELTEFTRASAIPYALDESIQDLEQDASLMESYSNIINQACAFIWKPTLVTTECMSKLVQAHPDTPVVLSAAFESGVGLASVARMATTRPSIPAAGLDTYSWLADDVLEERLNTNSPTLDLGTLIPMSQQIDTNKLTLLHEVDGT